MNEKKEKETHNSLFQLLINSMLIALAIKKKTKKKQALEESLSAYFYIFDTIPKSEHTPKPLNSARISLSALVQSLAIGSVSQGVHQTGIISAS